ncbi:MAG TPA: tetratricopeptide repeat protein [Balneolaceae bacterium]
MNNNSRDLALEKRIDAYVKGDLDEEQALRLWEDLLKRPDYIELLETELGVKSILERQAALKKSESLSSSKDAIIYQLQSSWKWVAAAAVVITMIVSMNLLQTKNSETARSLALGEINLRQHLITAPVTRSQTSQFTAADSLLNLGFKAAIGGNIDRALQFYNEVIAKYDDEPAAVRALLNIGMIQYNTRYFDKAIDSFKEAIKKVSEQPIAKEKAYWYLGNAYIHQDELVLARDAIQNVYQMDGIYNRPAGKLLERLNEKLGKAGTSNQ